MTEAELQAELAALQKRKANLLKVLEMRREVVELEEAVGKPTIIDIITDEVITDHIGLTHEDVRSNRRPNEIAVPRQIIFYLARHVGKVSYKSIGESFGKNHSTVIHGEKAIANRMSVEPRFKMFVEGIKEKCEHRINHYE